MVCEKLVNTARFALRKSTYELGDVITGCGLAREEDNLLDDLLLLFRCHFLKQ
jgi:hypothetical protein